MEAPGGFEPPNAGFANPSLNHLGMAPDRTAPHIRSRRRVKHSERCAVIRGVVGFYVVEIGRYSLEHSKQLGIEILCEWACARMAKLVPRI